MKVPNRQSAQWYMLAFAIFLGLVMSYPAHADDANGDAIQQVISHQLDAFAAHDAQRAFSFAAPGIKQGFKDAATFMTMVREKYPAVYGASTVRFRERTPHDGFEVQRVQFIGPEDGYWDAFYRMEKQENGQWRIGGVVMKAVKGGI